MLTAEPTESPRLQGQHADVAPGSPLAVVALFTEVVRERFRPPADAAQRLAWVWDDNPTPDPEATNEPDAPARIVIEPAFSGAAETRNYYPAIIVDKGETMPSKVALNNFIAQKLQTGQAGFFSLASIPMEIEVLSTSKSESATIADIVWFYLLSAREMLQGTFALHEMGEPVLGRTTNQRADQEYFVTSVNFTVQIPVRWVTKPIAPLLNSILVRYRDSGTKTLDTYLLARHLP